MSGRADTLGLGSVRQGGHFHFLNTLGITLLYQCVVPKCPAGRTYKRGKPAFVCSKTAFPGHVCSHPAHAPDSPLHVAQQRASRACGFGSPSAGPLSETLKRSTVSKKGPAMGRKGRGSRRSKIAPSRLSPRSARGIDRRPEARHGSIANAFPRQTSFLIAGPSFPGRHLAEAVIRTAEDPSSFDRELLGERL